MQMIFFNMTSVMYGGNPSFDLYTFLDIGSLEDININLALCKCLLDIGKLFCGLKVTLFILYIPSSS